MKIHTSISVLIVSLFALASCDDGTAVSDAYAARKPQVKIDAEYLKKITSSPKAVISYMSGNTGRNYSSGHGSQIEYTASNGTLALWYPGNNKVVKGYWKAQKSTKGDVQVCFKYPSSSFNPVTQETGGRWECTSAKLALAFDVERVSGDPFNLASGAIPFVLPRGQNISFAEIGSKTGIQPEKLNALQAPMQLK